MEQYTSKLWVNRSNRFRGARLSPGQTPFYFGVCLFFKNNYVEFLSDERGIENITSQIETQLENNDPYIL